MEYLHPPIHADFDVSGSHGVATMEIFGQTLRYKAMKPCSGRNKRSDHMGLELTRKDISNSYTLYLFDLEPVSNESLQFDLLKTGTLSLNAFFGTALTTNVSCLLYLEA